YTSICSLQAMVRLRKARTRDASIGTAWAVASRSARSTPAAQQIFCQHLDVESGSRVVLSFCYNFDSMAGLLIKELPKELHRKLKRRAEANRRSLSSEAITILE